MADLREQMGAIYDKLEGTATENIDTGTTEEHNESAEPVAATPKATGSAKVSEKVAKPDPKGQTAAAATPQERTAFKPPSTWAGEYQDHFGKLDPRVQEFILKREKEASDGISQYGDKLKQYQTRYDALEPLLASRRDAWKANGWTEDHALKQLLNLSDYASRDPRGFVKWFAQQQRLNLADLDYEPEQSQEAIPPQVQQVIGGLQQRLEQFERAQQDQRNREFQAQVQAFATEKDEQGLPKRPHFEDVRQDIMGWFQTILQADPNLSFTQALDQAYDRSVWGNPNVRAKILESQKAKEEEARVKEQKERDEQGRFVKAQDAKKSAVKSEPPEKDDESKGKKKDVRSIMSRKYDELAGKAAAV